MIYLSVHLELDKKRRKSTYCTTTLSMSRELCIAECNNPNGFVCIDGYGFIHFTVVFSTAWKG